MYLFHIICHDNLNALPFLNALIKLINFLFIKLYANYNLYLIILISKNINFYYFNLISFHLTCHDN